MCAFMYPFMEREEGFACLVMFMYGSRGMVQDCVRVLGDRQGRRIRVVLDEVGVCCSLFEFTRHQGC